MPDRALQPYVVARLVDESDSTAELRITIRSSAGRDAGMSAALLLAELADSASSCTATAVQLHYPIVMRPPAIPAPGANLRGFGILVFSTADPDQFAIVEIPGISSDLRDPADDTLLLLTAPALSAYITALIDGIFCNPFGYYLEECISGLYEIRQ